MATQFSPKSNLSRKNWPTRHAKPKSKLQLVQNFKFVKYENENLQLSTESKRTPRSCNSRGQTPSTAGVKNLKIVFFAIRKMKIFNLLLRATGEDFFETQVMQQPRADYRLDCCLQAWIGTPSVFAGFLK